MVRQIILQEKCSKESLTEYLLVLVSIIRDTEVRDCVGVYL